MLHAIAPLWSLKTLRSLDFSSLDKDEDMTTESLSYDIPNLRKREYGMRLMLAPRSARAFFIASGPMRHTNAVAYLSSFSLCDRRSLRTLAPFGMWIIASRKGGRCLGFVTRIDWGCFAPNFMITGLLVRERSGVHVATYNVIGVPSEGPPLLPLLYSFPMEGYHYSDRILGGKGHRRCHHLIGKLARVICFGRTRQLREPHHKYHRIEICVLRDFSRVGVMR
ncbi:hypothetical protein Tco_1145663 [Tanacetum coccineum]